MIRISRRDRMFLAVGGAFIILFVALQFGIFPLLDERQRLQRGIETRQDAVVEMRELQARYRELHGKANTLQDQLSERDPGFSLFSFMEQMAARAEVKDSIAYMRPSETADEGPFREVMVEMKLQEISLQQLVDILRYIEAPEKVVAVKRLSVQQSSKEKSTLDVIMQVVTLTPNPETLNG